MSSHKDHLSHAYDLTSVAETQKFYSDWAATYDAEILENGYATPERCAKVLAGFTPEQDLAVLDIGCGTGLSGKYLAQAGFTRIDGCDLNAEMLKVAETRGVYDKLWQSTLEDPFPFEDGTYDAITAVGVISIGGAPADLLYAMLKKLNSGGLAVFSFNDHTLDVPEYKCAMMAHTDCGAFELLFKEHGAHLPGKGIKSTVYVMRKR
ncbi:MAG: methyltransferase domain-containing protein [Rhodobacterales bacterium]